MPPKRDLQNGDLFIGNDPEFFRIGVNLTDKKRFNRQGKAKDANGFKVNIVKDQGQQRKIQFIIILKAKTIAFSQIKTAVTSVILRPL